MRELFQSLHKEHNNGELGARKEYKFPTVVQRSLLKLLIALVTALKMLSFLLLLVLATSVRAHFSQCGNGVEGAEGVKVTNLSPALNLTAPFLISHHKVSSTSRC
jgi:hypothetical protein